jgi:HlyD family secretion protein
MKTVLGIVVLTAAVTGLYFANELAQDENGKSILHVAGDLPILVRAAEPQSRNIIRTVQAPGEVEPLWEVDISAEVVGKILEMPVDEGDSVRRGDLLCRLDDADYKARLLSAEANVTKLKAVIAQAEADHGKAQRDFTRQVNLAEANATSSTEMADYRTALTQARTTVDIRKQELVEAQARLESAKKDLEKTVITAPIDGVISQLFAKQGEVVITGTMNNLGTRIMVVSDLSKMQVRCRVDETDAALVAPEQVASIFLQSDNQQSVAGRVVRVGTKGTKPQGRDVVTFETLVLVDSADVRVKPGMTANVEIEVARQANAVTVPVEAVVHRRRRDLPKKLVEQHDAHKTQLDPKTRGRLAEYLKVIYCIQDDRVQPRLVETGISDDTGVEVIDGIALGDRVVVGPYRSLDLLKEGSLIKFEDEKAKTADDGEETTGKTAESDASKTDDKKDEKAEEKDHRAASLAENREG